MTRNWVNIGSGNGLLPDGTKPLPEPMLTYHQRALSWEDLKISISKITFLESHSDLPGANEFKGGIRPVFERCQTLLHPELTPWWSFLLADGAHHKKSHSPTHPHLTLKIEGQGHGWGQSLKSQLGTTSYWLTSFWWIQPFVPIIELFLKFDLQNPRSKSYLKVT